MKSEYSSSWKKSVQPRKQRKYRVNAPLHIRGKFLSAPLSKVLREKHGMRSLRVRVGDEVEILRGSFKGEKGAVERLDTGRSKIFVRGVDRVEPKGGRKQIAITPSNVRLIKLVDDARRFAKQ